MILQSFAPPAELAPFVCAYLYGRSEYSEPQLIPMIPRGVPALMIVLNEEGDSHVEYIRPTRSGPLPNGMFLIGQTTQSCLLKVGANQAYMVALRPLALQALLRMSAADFTDSIINLDSVLPEGQLLVEQLVAEKSQFGQLMVLDTFLKRLFRNVILQPSEVQGAVHRILQQHGQIKVGELATQQRISARSLTRKFTDQVGVSPKQYAQIVRFRTLMHCLLLAPTVSWLDVVHRFGYYDQSHFIKDGTPRGIIGIN